tara:strand:+ start:17771 stop:17944 length:174 start_codon:yes stop_codon:yes gene_type:complete
MLGGFALTAHDALFWWLVLHLSCSLRAVEILSPGQFNEKAVLFLFDSVGSLIVTVNR